MYNNLIFGQCKMTQYNSLNVKLLDSQLNKLKSAIKIETEAVLRLPSNMIGNCKGCHIIQSGGFFGKLVGPLVKIELPLMKNVIKPLIKSVFIPLGLTAAASAADTGRQKNLRISSNNTNNIKWWNGRHH